MQAGPKNIMQVLDGRFTDYRWVGGRWELDQFKQADGSTNWNEVRAEAGRGRPDVDTECTVCRWWPQQVRRNRQAVLW